MFQKDGNVREREKKMLRGNMLNTQRRKQFSFPPPNDLSHVVRSSRHMTLKGHWER